MEKERMWISYPQRKLMKIEVKPIIWLRENSKNARGIKKEDFERLKKQIQKHGIYKPLIVNEEGIVIGGNMRLRAYKELGMTEVEVSIVEAKTEAEIFALGLSDNDRTGYYEEQDLAELIQEYGLEIGLEDYKVDLGQTLSLTDVLNQFAPDIEEDEVLEVSKGEPESKLGEVYQLGRHRLMCGDATKREDVEKLMDGQKADMVFTDPPYGINVVKIDGMIGENRKGKVGYAGLANTRVYNSIIGDDKPFDPTFLLNLAPHLIIWGSHNFASKLPDNSKWIVWDKKGEMQLDNDFSDCELAWTNYEGKKIKKYTHIWAGMTRQGIRDLELNERVHPTQKPVTLLGNILKDFSKDNNIILDLFGGSGSTLIACEQTNRICYMMEIDPKYVDVIRKRYENFTKNK